MSCTFKIAGGIVAVIIIAVIAVFIYVYSNLDSIVKDAVEKYGPQYTGVTVKLAKVSLSPESGEGTLSGLVIGNPPGYKTDLAFKLGSISMTVDLSSLTSGTIVIKSIVVDRPDVTYEFGDGGSNIDVISKNVQKAAGTSSSGGKAAPAGGEKKAEGGGQKMIVKSLIVKDGTVSVSHPLLQGKKISAGLPTIRLANIGEGKKEGATPAEVVAKVMQAIDTQVAVAVSHTNVNDLLKGLGKGAEGAVKGLTDGASGAASGAAGAAKDAGDALKNLLGK